MATSFFLDTNIIVNAIRKSEAQVRARILREIDQNSPMAVSSIVVSELFFGVARSKRFKENKTSLLEFLAAPLTIIPFDKDDAFEAGEIRGHLIGQGTPIGPLDTLIAAQARRRGAVLVTNNRKEFDRVPGLMVTDWT